jgi:putative transposase
MSKISKGRGYVYSIQYHVVWCVKYRRDILTGRIEESLRNILQIVANGSDFQITEFNCERDHVHLLLNCKPQHYIPDMIKGLKGVSGRLLMKEFGNEIKTKLCGGHIWNPSYFIATVSENTEAQVRAYIQSQKER